MQLIPLLRFWRDTRAGATAGAVVAIGFTVWRVAREGDLVWTALSLLAMAALFGAALGWYGGLTSASPRSAGLPTTA